MIKCTEKQERNRKTKQKNLYRKEILIYKTKGRRRRLKKKKKERRKLRKILIMLLFLLLLIVREQQVSDKDVSE